MSLNKYSFHFFALYYIDGKSCLSLLFCFNVCSSARLYKLESTASVRGERVGNQIIPDEH